MLHATKGIVLRAVKYGETSLVVSIYTELFGLQSYLINGVRTEKRTSAKANMFQPTTLLDMIVYHHPHKNLQRIKEAQLLYVKNFQGAEVVRYAIGIYMVELIQKAITETETNAELYQFFDESFSHVLHEAEGRLSNFPILFTLLFAEHLGFGIQNNYSPETPLFNVQSGNFIAENEWIIPHRIDREHSRLISEILWAQHTDIQMSGSKRLELLLICLQYLQLHIPQMSDLKSVPVLHEILS
ncbi:MAG: DNA repair protein RecO [Chitinophagaceae bacterium]|nr:DNA repair protein RecO [Chitinophagaceae bacterium]